VNEFRVLVRKLTRPIIFKLRPPLRQQICAQGKSEVPDLFGSSVIDFLECHLDCKKDISVNIDSEGWCYIKGQYTVNGSYLYRFPGDPFWQEPLNVCEQKQLYEWLYNFTKKNNNFYLFRLRHREIFHIDFNDVLSKLDRVICYYGAYYWTLYDLDYNHVHLIFKVDLKCRKELAPIELLLELLKEESCENNEDESVHGTHTGQDPGPDLELKLQVMKVQNWSMQSRVVYKCLIQQRHTDS
jgi:hypothetical protein